MRGQDRNICRAQSLGSGSLSSLTLFSISAAVEGGRREMVQSPCRAVLEGNKLLFPRHTTHIWYYPLHYLWFIYDDMAPYQDHICSWSSYIKERGYFLHRGCSGERFQFTWLECSWWSSLLIHILSSFCSVTKNLPLESGEWESVKQFSYIAVWFTRLNLICNTNFIRQRSIYYTDRHCYFYAQWTVFFCSFSGGSGDGVLQDSSFAAAAAPWPGENLLPTNRIRAIAVLQAAHEDRWSRGRKCSSCSWDQLVG